ncbi:hypothetical protein [Baekduia sp. Peel2402]|uniref:hypothetical protein n=1 Tax=Baekduia sp. Peel2402 TaxID=3458296 RepID=UPI00403EEF23
MDALAFCLQALAETEGTDLHLTDGVAYGRSRNGQVRELAGVSAVKVSDALDVLIGPVTDAQDAEDLGVISTDTGERFRVSILPASRRAVLRRVPTPPTKA